MSNVRAVLAADIKEMGFSDSYAKFILSKFDDGIVGYEPDTKEIVLTEKAKREGYSLRSANSLN